MVFIFFTVQSPVKWTPSTNQTTNESESASSVWFDDRPKKASQAYLNDFARSLLLTKDQTRLFFSRFKENGWAADDVRVKSVDNRSDVYASKYKISDGMVYCPDIQSI